jgi:TPR repeat protein
LNLALAAAPSAQSTGAFVTSELVNAAHQLNADDLPRLRARAESGEGRAQVLLGLAYEMGGAGLKPQPPMALSWFLKAADQGITWAQVWAADFYLSGSDAIRRRRFLLARSTSMAMAWPPIIRKPRRGTGAHARPTCRSWSR